MSSFGILGLLPFILTLFFLLWQRDVVFPIVGGLIIGSILLSQFNPLLGLFHAAGDIVSATFTERSTILVLILLGETLLFFSLLNRSGYIHAFTKKLAQNKMTKGILEVIVLASGVIVCIDRYLSVMLVGLFSRPFSERKKLPPLKHAYILNTSTSAVSTLIPFTTVAPLIVTVIGTTFEGLGIEYSPVSAFYRSIPYQFYTIFALFTAITTIVLKKDAFLLGEGKYRDSAPLLHLGTNTDKGRKASETYALYGVAAALLVVFSGILFSLIFEEKIPIVTAAENIIHLQLILVNALFSGIIFIIIFLLLTKSSTYNLLKTVTIPGIPLMTILYILLAMAVHTLAKKIGFQSSITGMIFDGSTPAIIIPLAVFLLSSVFSFLSGSSALTITTMIPLGLKLLSRSLPDPHIVGDLTFATIAAVLSGASFGDNNSPLSITFILSTAVTKSSVNGHFNTQIIYSAIAAGVSIVFGYVLHIVGVLPYLSITIGFLVIAGTFILVNRKNLFQTNPNT